MAALIDSGQVSINCHAAVDSAIPLEATNNPVGEENLEKKDWILISNKGHYSYVLIYQGTWLPNRSKNLPLSFALIDSNMTCCSATLSAGSTSASAPPK